MTACVLAILSSMPAGAGVVTVPTDYGDGADAFARAGSYANENYGTGNGLTVKGSPNPDYARKAWLRFDLSGVLGTPEKATLQLYLATVSGGITIRGWALNDANADPLDGGSDVKVPEDAPGGWSETGLTWNNAPGNDTGHTQKPDEGETDYLFTYSLTSGDSDTVFSHESTAGLNGQLLANVLNDTNDRLTIMITGYDDKSVNIASKENDTHIAPTLILEGADVRAPAAGPVPEPAGLGLLGLAMLALKRRRR